MIVLLYIGGLIGGFILPYVGHPVGWYSGIIIGIIQILFLALFGMFAKLGIIQILIGVVVILIGGIFGGLIAEQLSLGGLFNTVTILAIQSLLLMATGFVKPKPSVKV